MLQYFWPGLYLIRTFEFCDIHRDVVSRPRSRSRDRSRPIFCGLGLGLKSCGLGLGLETPGLGLGLGLDGLVSDIFRDRSNNFYSPRSYSNISV